MNQLYYYNVLVEKPFSNYFTYSCKEMVEIGSIVSVPFNRSVVNGLVVSKVEKLSIDERKIKEIAEIYDFKITPQYLTFIKFCANYNMAPEGLFLKMMLSQISVLKKFSKYEMETPLLEDLDKKLATLSSKQQNVLESIKEQIDKFEVSVLQGVTGSGKTEVYLHLAAEIIQKGGQVLIMLPEIALGSQLVQRYEERLGIKPLIWNSQEGEKSKKITWYNGVIKKYPLIVGARSSLFIPYSNLKLIIIDEEHDSSFKQEEGVIYNARDMAVVLAKNLNIPLVLASATPSIETLYNAKHGKYKLYEITSRFGGVSLPEIEIVDTLQNKLEKGKFISKQAKEQIFSEIKKGKQVLIYLNRRGYAPVSFCSSCGHKYECPKCSANLVKHKFNDFLICHYCGYKSGDIKSCISCGVETDIFAYGPGVERIEEELKADFPDMNILVFSSDTLKPKEVESTVNKIKNGEFDIIVGTQMITKGFHFPKLSTVLILDFDWSIKGFDLRAHEKAYQALYQVSGRAGREKERGKVLIQTMEPENYLIDTLKNCTHKNFIEQELQERELAKMPPTSNIGLINFEATHENTIIKYTRELSKIRVESPDIKVLGPTPSPIFKLRGKFRYRFVVIAYSKGGKLQNFIASWLNSVPKPRSLKIKIDIDPINFS